MNQTLRPTNQEPNLFAIFASRLNDQKLSYMITGSVASIVYGDPRLTHDIDIVLELGPSDVINFIAAFPAEEFYVAPIEVIRDQMLRSERGHFNLIHLQTGFNADIYLKGDNELHLWGMERTKKIEFQGIMLSVAPPEYVILRKLEYYREGHPDKHLSDIKNILKNSGELLDIPFIESYCGRQGLADLWRSVKEGKRVKGRRKKATRKKKTPPKKGRAVRSKK
jgi:hypothetical protein